MKALEYSKFWIKFIKSEELNFIRFIASRKKIGLLNFPFEILLLKNFVCFH